MSTRTCANGHKRRLGGIADGQSGLAPRSPGLLAERATSRRGFTAVTLQRPKGTKRRVSAVVKRLCDFVLAFFALVVLFPVLVVVAIAIKIESRGPILYRARRVGYLGRPLLVLKFRKMLSTADGFPLTRASDERFTRIGNFLSRTHIDELPQLWNVLLGEMSLVGPRPEDPRFVSLYSAAYEEILRVRPGITGWTQLVFSDETLLLGSADPVRRYVETLLPHKVSLDCEYARSAYRLRDDLKLLLWTPLITGVGLEVAFIPDFHQLRLVRKREERVNAELAPDPALADVIDLTDPALADVIDLTDPALADVIDVTDPALADVTNEAVAEWTG
jgi:lipopolysaccharide/colanic/teichoic acid biosynthesis glycosyltransferase